ncbi:hypothetical protein, partial [Mycobacterium sp. NAZ190054]|uniref:hypothetical protein n=1 Tax=Mycobacterium sp. NAZ190054 TaxID=1747766 RepID=UPI0018D2332B
MPIRRFAVLGVLMLLVACGRGDAGGPDPAAPSSDTQPGSAAPSRLSCHQWPSRSHLSTESDHPPAASGMRGPSP